MAELIAPSNPIWSVMVLSKKKFFVRSVRRAYANYVFGLSKATRSGLVMVEGEEVHFSLLKS